MLKPKPEFNIEVRHSPYQAAIISLKITAGCLNPKHFLGRLLILDWAN